ncbi:MAG: hypothetical protein BWK80_10355 [Desulfobacteraceae bacterium IS3]|nr:MAG: hypothetical protein BWK80_10355 [Desulfobacteraceae bacterium IS3]
MIRFAYPNVKQRENRFIGCGRYAVSDTQPGEKYETVSKIMNIAKMEKAVLELAGESFNMSLFRRFNKNQETLSYRRSLLWVSANKGRGKSPV